MKVAFLFSEYVLHNHIIEEYRRARQDDQLLVVKIPLTLKSKSRIESAQRVFPKLSRRFITAKLVEFAGLKVITYTPKLLSQGAVFRRLRRIASRNSAGYLEAANVHSPNFLSSLAQFAPDVIVTLMHQIVGQPLLAIPKYGTVNIHPGLLPQFRGIQPYFWSLSEGAAHGGCSLHLIEDESIDTGALLAQAKFPLAAIRSVQLNYYLTAIAAAKLLPPVLEGLSTGELKPIRQSGEGRYYRWPDSAAYDRLWRRGANLLSWSDLWGILSGRYDTFEPTEVLIAK